MAQLNALRRKRGGKKSSVTSLKTYLDKFYTDYNYTDTDIIEINSRISSTEKVFDEFCTIQTEIEETCDDEHLEQEYKERQSFESDYYHLIAVAKNMVISKNQNSRLSSQANTVSNPIPCSMQIKLPKIKLPTFAGSYDHWVEFKDMFLSMVDQSSISNIEKLQYLKSSLSGQAAQLIIALEISEKNYKVAWEILCDRYDNKKVLINNHIKAIFNLNVIKNETASELRRLVDELSKHLLALKALDQQVEFWDPLLLYIITNKLDNVTKRDWEISQSRNDTTTVEDLKQFLRSHCHVLETLEGQKKNINHFKHSTSLISTNTTKKCCICKKDNHHIYSCNEFLKLDVNNRIKIAKQNKLCLNCLKFNHTSLDCWGSNCKKCNKKHNTLLHLNSGEQTRTNEPGPSTIVVSCNTIHSNVILSTALVEITKNNGNSQICRALLDCGSEQNFITWELFDKLQLEKTPIDLAVIGISQIKTAIKYKTELTLSSTSNSFSKRISCLIIDKITENIPHSNYDISKLQIPDNIRLCDPNFNKPNKVDLLIGANIFWDLLRPQQIKLGKNQPIIQKTVLGWIISGPISCNKKSNRSVCNLATNCEIQDNLKAFWEIEECDNDVSIDASFCETYFTKTTTRDESGRFVVKIPFKEPTPQLGDSYQIALKRFSSLEKKLQNNSDLKQEYISFMKEYETLNHMSDIKKPSEIIDNTYYLPHHAVIKENSTTSKLRVVFDGSCKTSNNLSLNDIQFKGPTIQNDLFDILLRFRTHKYILSADIEKMYRQISINEDQRDYQRILWRDDPNSKIKHYRLNTVTYGTKSAPYLAVRSLQEVAHINKSEYPLASKIILNDFYVDDLLTGCCTVEEGVKMYSDLNTILNSAGFKLRKWVSNSNEILSKLNSSVSHGVLDFNSNNVTRTLGLTWKPTSDNLCYEVNVNNEIIDTKRTILSQISKIFDPLGLLGPVIITAKILLQEIWSENLDWDDILPKQILLKWQCLKQQLKHLAKFQIPRYIIETNVEIVELHVFSDASLAAYGTCAYIRIISNNIKVNLLSAKSRVAPLKVLTVPRLELCAAVLSTKLVTRILNTINVHFHRVYFWCDSTIVLSWLQLTSNDLNVFVANRVSKIQAASNAQDWYYIRSKDNPADIISRGASIEYLAQSTWWHGPLWLSMSKNDWPSEMPNQNITIPELKATSKTLLIGKTSNSSVLFSMFSSFDKLKRIIATCLRFVSNCKLKKGERRIEPLSVSELEYTEELLIRLAQQESFHEEILFLQDKTKATPKLNFRQLSPFIDKKNLLRVGGRLENSDFTMNKKHPLLLCGKHPLAKLLMKREHVNLLHGGPQLMLASIRSHYWPTGGKNLAKGIVHDCISCFKAKPRSNEQFMGNLPKDRLALTYPFLSTGVDYGGPFLLKQSKGRCNKTYKAYLCIFVCLATKAIHIEPVTELTTNAFISMFRRFVSRRGKPKNVYSDNGTNFIGAASKLIELGKFLSKNHQLLSSITTNDNIHWHFNPAQSPHFGGLWESGIKSIKHHLRRVVGNTLLTFEEFLTLLTQIESILNSRPLCPLSTSPNDYDVLTPSHFLIGRSSTSIPDPDVSSTLVNRLTRYEHIQQMRQHFWKRWQLEYLSELQVRTKWLKQTKNLQIGQLVILKDENAPPLRWKMARITEVHPGTDGIVRVVSVTTGTNSLKRAVNRLCVLPVPMSES